MQFKENAVVHTSDGRKVGHIDRVVIDPNTKELTHLLISQGLVSKTSKLIPSMWVDQVLEDEVRLSINQKFVEDLPEYAPQD